MQQVASEERKRRSRLATALFHRYHPYAGRVGQTYTALVTEVAADGKHYVAHNMAYEQILVPMKDEYLGRELEVRPHPASMESP
jgi:threonylcarbamoyladenosine tRNA methylthiotransferase CDKAL1